MPGRLGATMGIWPKSGMGSCARPNGHSKAGRIEPGPAGWPKLGRHHGQAEQRDGEGVRSPPLEIKSRKLILKFYLTPPTIFGGTSWRYRQDRDG
eukprot:SAG31_NODE_378_length_16503_cov_28.830041_9_plen_95_part_00